MSPEVRAASSANTAMNSAPMRLRFTSGSVTPFKPRQESLRRHPRRSPACPRAAPAVRWCRWNSFLRSSPLSTKTFVSRSPMARCTSAAATAESTPPLSAQMARSFPTCSRMASTVSAMNDAPLQFGCAPQISKDKIAQDFGAALGVPHLGMKLHRENAPRGILGRRKRIAGGAGDVKARRQAPARDRRGSSRSSAAAGTRRRAASRRAIRVPPGHIRGARRAALARPACARSTADRSRCPAPARPARARRDRTRARPGHTPS